MSNSNLEVYPLVKGSEDGLGFLVVVAGIGEDEDFHDVSIIVVQSHHIFVRENVRESSENIFSGPGFIQSVNPQSQSVLPPILDNIRSFINDKVS